MDLTLAFVIGAVVAVLLAVGIWLVVVRRGLTRSVEDVNAAWESVVTSIRERDGVIERLVATAPAASVQQLAGARQASLGARTPEAVIAAEAPLQRALRAVQSGAAGADSDALALQSELALAEDSLQSDRRSYNGGVRALNAKRTSFPSSLFAKGLGVTERSFLEADATSAVAEPPRIQF